MPKQAPASNLFILRYLCPTQSPSFQKNAYDIIAYDLRFGPPTQSKILAMSMFAALPFQTSKAATSEFC